MPEKSNKIVQYVKDSYKEFKKVTWPSKKEVQRHTIMVVAISLGVALFLGFVDYLLAFGINEFIIK